MKSGEGPLGGSANNIAIPSTFLIKLSGCGTSLCKYKESKYLIRKYRIFIRNSAFHENTIYKVGSSTRVNAYNNIPHKKYWNVTEMEFERKT